MKMAKKSTSGSEKDYKKVIESAIEKWADLKEMKTWEAKSNIKYSEWKQRFIEYTLVILPI